METYPTPFDMDRAIELTKLGASDQEVIEILGVTAKEMTVERKRVLARYRAERIVRLKAKLYELALKGNANAVMQLLRNHKSK